MPITSLNSLPVPASLGPPAQIRRGAFACLRRCLKPLSIIAFLAIVFSSSHPCLAAPTNPIVINPNLLPLWSGWKQIPDGASPFLTDRGCSVAAYPGQALYVVAQRSTDHSIWLNSTGDPSSKPYGWKPVTLDNGAPAKSAYAPSISYFFDSNTATLYLDIVAVGIHGGLDMSVYVKSKDLTDNLSGVWMQVPGFGTNSSVSISGRSLVARGFSYGSPSPLYATFYEGASTAAWGLVAGHTFAANAQPCPFLSTDGQISTGKGGLYASLGSSNALYSLMTFTGPYQTSFSLWSPVAFQPLTDAKAAGPLPNTPSPIYTAFVKGIGDHQVHGVRASGLQVIGGID
jgi:hypothetical protein